MVTTFVRTPADTVMLAHTNGYLTINGARCHVRYFA